MIHCNLTFQSRLINQTSLICHRHFFAIQVRNNRGMLKSQNIQVTQFNQVFLRIIERLIIQKVTDIRYKPQNYKFTQTEITGKNEEFGGSGNRSFGGGRGGIPEGKGRVAERGLLGYFRGGSKSQKFQPEMGLQVIR